MKKLILSLVFISTISIQAGHHEMAKDAVTPTNKMVVMTIHKIPTIDWFK